MVVRYFIPLIKHKSVEPVKYTPPTFLYFYHQKARRCFTQSIYCFRSAIYFLCLLMVAPITHLQAGELSGNISLEGRYFTGAGAFDGQQKSGGLSLSILPEYKHKWDDDHKQFTFTPFYRWDSNDKERTHIDIRQLDFVASEGNWEYQVGISKLYWGVTESQHLVDIINQTDGVEGLDDEDKLGQPMIRISRLFDDSALDLIVLPYFRERTFAGGKGRFRTPLVVDADAATYESSKEEKHVDLAIRWSGTIDEFDVGLSHFEGTSRDPTLRPIIKRGEAVGLQPHYPLMKQTSLDLQYTGESTIWKLEVINRDVNNDTYYAAVGGFEHTLAAFESGLEIGLLAEYNHDSRGEKPGVAFQNDIFVGARYALNNEAGSELLAGAFIDLDNQSKSFRVEASQRLGNGFKINIEGQIFTDVDKSDPFLIFEKDDYIQVELQKFF